MRKDIKFIVISDPHFQVWNQYNKGGIREKIYEIFFEKLRKLWEEYNKPPILCAGDWFQTNEHLKNETLDFFLPKIKVWFKGMNVFGIPGNHDISGTNPKINYTNWFKLLFSYYDLTEGSIDMGGKYQIFGIPYLLNNIGLDKYIEKSKSEFIDGTKKILLLHTDLHGAVDTNGFEVSSVQNIPRDYSIFDGFDLVLSGHIHKYQAIAKNIFIIGSIGHTRTTDNGCDMGCLLIDSKLGVTFKKIKTPQFKYIGIDGEEDDENIWITPNQKDISSYEEKLSTDFFDTEDRVTLAKSYLKARNIKDRDKRKLLIKLINESHDSL